ncbi:hypothetical protein BU25DRAFT_483602 [Macroventuria anomochaeta]|uniref:Uncharacterized protein n=1 Tax=Macroventuria anomochaeta TaxID=301207 RepID=A0ACB6S9B4_9PLEO|nr:uncharacterized protein BU25DRAFT_483602 [Macroventuria anomochaeta]KAF2630796.1 hypothetical protein BU25DRAFT_483602 [Macroventuria anomochaeta]
MPMFASRFKLPIHIVTGLLVIIIIGLSVPRLFMKNQPRTRAGTIALGMASTTPNRSVSQETNNAQGDKSLILLTYMLAAEHVQNFKRWHSYKTNVVISCLEIVVWGAVAFLVFQGNLKTCVGVTCYLSWVVVGIAVVINHLEIYASAIATREFRNYRKMRDGMPLSSVMSRGTDEDEMMQRFPPQPENAYQGHREQRHVAPPRHHAQVVRGKQ